jgi:radical SAM superfamily enzyme YgiQ (UPF0313 family)
MKITLIKPMIGSRRDFREPERYCMEPLELATVAALTPSGIDVEMFDDRIEHIPYDIRTDLVGITSDTFTAKRAYTIAAAFRRRHIPVVMGGCHPTVVPDEAIQYCDSVVVGEAEEVWARLVTDVQENRLQRFYRSGGPVSLKGRSARREIFKGKPYLSPPLVEFGRGCTFRCTFCSIGIVYGHTYRHRPVPEVIEEIRRTGKRRIFFCDDNIVADPEAAKELFAAMIPLKIQWASQASLNLVSDPELVSLMARSGCWGLLIGFESLHRDTLAQMNKECNLMVRSYRDALARIRDKGIKVWASFMVGWDHDTRDTIEEIMRFAVEEKFFLVNFNTVLPYPGTPLYKTLAREGRILFDAWWLHEGFFFGGVPFLPAHFSPEELSRICYQARLRYNSWWPRVNRGFDFKANTRGIGGIFEFFRSNRIFLEEVRRKQGMALGFKHE